MIGECSSCGIDGTVMELMADWKESLPIWDPGDHKESLVAHITCVNKVDAKEEDTEGIKYTKLKVILF